MARILLALAFPALALSSVADAQLPIDLRTWTAESYGTTGVGDWTVSADGTTVTQSVNGNPTVFFSPFTLVSGRVEGRVRITSSTDDDYVGFAIGYRPGDATNPAADYLLIDWKNATQTYDFGAPSCTPGSTAQRGLAVSRVHGIPTADEFWGHVDFVTAPCSTANDRVDEVVRATNLGASAWARNVDYTFTFDVSDTGVEVRVDGRLEAVVPGNFTLGRMAFYNFSQGGVVYSAFSLSCGWLRANYGTGFPGTSGVPTLTSSPPLLSSQITIQGSNVAGVDTEGILIYGLRAASLESGFGGRILVDPILFESHHVPVTGMTHQLTVPTDPAFCGRPLYLQHVHVDAGAAQWLAFSPGLILVLGA